MYFLAFHIGVSKDENSLYLVIWGRSDNERTSCFTIFSKQQFEAFSVLELRPHNGQLMPSFFVLIWLVKNQQPITIRRQCYLPRLRQQKQSINHQVFRFYLEPAACSSSGGFLAIIKVRIDLSLRPSFAGSAEHLVRRVEFVTASRNQLNISVHRG